ncbi:ubiquinol-cytochrome c reductase iron-sulfur subunit [Tepidiforma sp.]|jgi:cytochrome b6-f complex iron-sulfur subunit|uniref:QcrA and Rieske domain-containing protein n=1 Tax=Tepidiforma sp. TaxID=2682230 RepID=UPI0026245255|nr:ubiquinol-cytochrome c reductase iron-sulfur subunit [Tepidiforma sp.]MCX7617792.1 ubiquinol-cytochrome c reductase iron-sulfur subunit [Tepidiforma sp.]
MAAETAPRATGRIERARQIEARKLARRSFLRVSAFAGLTLFTGGLIASFLGFFNLRRPSGFGGTVTVTADRIPRPGADPVRIPEGKFWLVNLNGPEGDVLQVGGTGGLLALYWKCPHLGCTVPWNPAFNGAQVNFPGIIGWFRCPCHGSTYSKAGIRVYGPAPRPMDTMRLTVNADGSVNVNTGQITSGSADNPLRAVPYA